MGNKTQIQTHTYTHTNTPPRCMWTCTRMYVHDACAHSSRTSTRTHTHSTQTKHIHTHTHTHTLMGWLFVISFIEIARVFCSPQSTRRGPRRSIISLSVEFRSAPSSCVLVSHVCACMCTHACVRGLACVLAYLPTCVRQSSYIYAHVQT